MDKYISLDAAIAYLEKHKVVAKEQNIILAANEDAIIKFLKEKCPAVDAVPVVRCKDCKHRKRPLFAGNGIYCVEQCRHFELDDFCSYGERREGE